jgi:hypothetical protein
LNWDLEDNCDLQSPNAFTLSGYITSMISVASASAGTGNAHFDTQNDLSAPVRDGH